MRGWIYLTLSGGPYAHYVSAEDYAKYFKVFFSIVSARGPSYRHAASVQQPVP